VLWKPPRLRPLADLKHKCAGWRLSAADTGSETPAIPKAHKQAIVSSGNNSPDNVVTVWDAVKHYDL
jgi:hypothetical protein